MTSKRPLVQRLMRGVTSLPWAFREMAGNGTLTSTIMIVLVLITLLTLREFDWIDGWDENGDSAFTITDAWMQAKAVAKAPLLFLLLMISKIVPAHILRFLEFDSVIEWLVPYVTILGIMLWIVAVTVSIKLEGLYCSRADAHYRRRALEDERDGVLSKRDMVIGLDGTVYRKGPRSD